MKFTAPIRKTFAAGLTAVIVAAGATSTAFAHVTVKPTEVVTAGYQTFTVSVPNEKDIPTVSVKVLIPDSIASATPTQKSGWEIVKETAGDKTTSITWQGGSIGDGTRDEFTFSAKVPEKSGELQWKAYQTYEDGTVVAWDQASEGGHGHDSENPNAGPFSVTKVVAETTQETALQKAEQAAANAQTIAERSLYFSIAALALGIVGIFLGTRKK